jgi:phosphohistidine phosphatase
LILAARLFSARNGIFVTKTLYLLRHAKASRPADGQGDSDRPLSKRGQAAAAAMARHLKARAILPDLVLCSPALRTRETLAGISQAWPRDVATEFRDQLYLADADVALRQLQRLDERLNRVMLIGHNPGLADLALLLAGAHSAPDVMSRAAPPPGAGDAAARRRMAVKYPTGALAEIILDTDRWREIETARGRLIGFVTPEMLAG